MKHTKSDYRRQGDAQVWKQVRQAADAVINPTDYYVGRVVPEPLVPENVLLFRRDKPPGKIYCQHHRFELVMNLAGRGSILLDDVYFQLEVGQALLIFPYQYHSFHFASDNDTIKWLFVTYESAHTENFLPMRNRAVTLTPRALDFAGRLALEYSRATPSMPANSAVIFTCALLLNELLQAAEKCPALRGPLPDGSPLETVAAISRFVDGNMGAGVGIKEIAAHMGMSQSNLRGFFRKTMRVSLGTFLRAKRTLRAMNLLSNSNLRLWAIAEQCGFSSPYSLSRAFKQEHGSSPKEFRQTHQRKRK